MLKKILDFDNFKSSKEVEKKLIEISNELFYNSELHTKNGKYLITQIELFFSQNTKDNLSTEKCNAHSHQSTFGKFYVHKTIKNNKLKSPKHIGLDISCGKEFNRYGGILIRAMKNLDTNIEIIGPSNVLNKLVNNPNSTNEKFTDEIKLALFDFDGLDIYDNDEMKIINIANHVPLFSGIQVENYTSTSQFSKLYKLVEEEVRKAA